MEQTKAAAFAEAQVFHPPSMDVMKIQARYIFERPGGAEVGTHEEILYDVPQSAQDLPQATIYGENANGQHQAYRLVPSSFMEDPFLRAPHIIVTCTLFDPVANAAAAAAPTNISDANMLMLKEQTLLQQQMMQGQQEMMHEQQVIQEQIQAQQQQQQQEQQTGEPLCLDESLFTSQYTVGKLLGAGGYAEVYASQDKSNGSLVAVKVVDKAKVEADNMTSSLETETAILRLLSGTPHLLCLRQVYVGPARIYLVTDLYQGGDLASFLEQGLVSERNAQLAMKSLMYALATVHRHNIAHRDIKPDNIVLSDANNWGTAHLVDFGVAIQFDNPTACTDEITGTPDYIAPELIQTAKQMRKGYGKSVDLWAMGIVAYMLVTGYHPIDAPSTKEMIQQVLNNTYKIDWSDISDVGADFISRLLTYNPSTRMSAEEALTHPWLQV